MRMKQDIPLRKLRTIHAEPLLSGQFTIRELKKLLAGGGMTQSLHRHDYFFILAVEKGKGKHEIDFVSQPVTDYSIFIMRPGQVHQLTLDPHSNGYLLEFKPEFYFPGDKMTSSEWRRLSALGKCKLTPTAFKHLMEPVSAILKEYASRAEGYEKMIRAYLDLFFIGLLRQRNRDGKDISLRTYDQEQLGIFLDLLEMNFSTLKQTSEYAARMYLSTYQLNKITKKGMGKTASELINEQVILEARRLLLATSGQVGQISSQLGYEDVSYFIRFFKKHTGYTPEAYRRHFS